MSCLPPLLLSMEEVATSQCVFIWFGKQLSIFALKFQQHYLRGFDAQDLHIFRYCKPILA